ncbi:RNA polymerase sigma factor [Actinomycetospora sp. SF1]|nr:RNA polymerase sigma factor [Actinomycetospora soli]
MSAARGGDNAAFDELLARHSRVLRATALRVLGDPDDADDAVQEALIRAWRYLGSFRGDSDVSVRAWLHRITANRALVLRSRRQTTLGDAALERLLVVEPGYDLVEVYAELRALLSELSPSHREILFAQLIADLPVAEIAELEQLALGTVKSRAARARAALAEQYRLLQDRADDESAGRRVCSRPRPRPGREQPEVPAAREPRRDRRRSPRA